MIPDHVNDCNDPFVFLLLFDQEKDSSSSIDGLESKLPNLTEKILEMVLP